MDSPTPPPPCAIAVSVCGSRPADSVPALLESLRLAGARPESVLVVVPPGRASAWPGAAVADRDAGELTALAHVAANPRLAGGKPWVLHMVDTCVAGEHFAPQLQAVCAHASHAPSTSEAAVACVLAAPTATHLGLFDARWLATNATAREWSRREHAVASAVPGSVRSLGPARTVGEFRYAEDDDARAIVHYPVLDLYEFAPVDLAPAAADDDDDAPPAE